MAEVPSTFTLQAGQSAPDFSLPDGSGRQFPLRELSAGKKGVLIAFVCNHCPFVIHLAEEMGRYAADYEGKGIQTIAINSNDVANYPADSPEKMVTFAEESKWTFPYLYDESQGVAKAYAAACTPDFYLFDGEGKLHYAGEFDSSRPGRGDASGASLRAATDQLLDGEAAATPWYPSSGCNIKWIAGAEPGYFG